MRVRYGAIVNIVTLIVYFIYFCVALWLSVRKGLGHNFPWMCMVILSLCRLTQVTLDLAATSIYPIQGVPNTTLESGVAILTEISLTPLFMSTASVLNMTSNPKGRWMQWILILLHVPLIISLILIVAGGIDPDARDTSTFAATATTKAGITIYCACFVVLIWATTTIAARLYLATSVEVKILTTVVISLPFFLVDVVYMMCFAFEPLKGDQRFNVISGSVTIQLCMQVIMEYIIVGLYLGLGLELPDKAAWIRDQIVERDFEQMRETFLWKLYELMSTMVAAVVMPTLFLSHYLLGKLLRSGS